MPSKKSKAFFISAKTVNKMKMILFSNQQKFIFLAVLKEHIFTMKQ